MDMETREPRQEMRPLNQRIVYRIIRNMCRNLHDGVCGKKQMKKTP